MAKTIKVSVQNYHRIDALQYEVRREFGMRANSKKERKTKGKRKTKLKEYENKRRIKSTSTPGHED